MADLEQRVATLEREMTTLKTRVGANEEDFRSVPDLIRLEFRLANSRIARLSQDVEEMRGQMGELRSQVDQLPRVLAEMLAERDRRR
jgi:hypothetical protein